MIHTMDKLKQYFSSAEFWDACIRAPLILLGAWLVTKILTSFMRKLQYGLIQKAALAGDNNLEAKKRIETLLKLVRQGLNLSIWAMAILASLKEFGMDIRPLLTSVGILGLAIGFGAQNLVKDLISGFFIILENQVRVGDSATLNGVSGQVERINLRTIVLRDVNGALHFFPNGSISSVCNMTKDWSAYVFQIGVSYDTSIEKALKTIQLCLEELKKDEQAAEHMLGYEIFGVDMLDLSSVNIKGRIRTSPGQQAGIGRKFLRLAKEAMDQNGIEIPYPHQKVIYQEQKSPLK